ncbi:MAG: hypothetical protein HQL26_05250 [Candidatus Omnitrophica bacterium]|nr:hypothetical protein [Candidatus Omnitrophota bacterium]
MKKNLILFFLMPLLLTGCVSTLRTSPDYTRSIPAIKTIAVMPIDIKVWSLTAGGVKELRDDWSEQANHFVLQALMTNLQSIPGIQVKFINKDWMNSHLNDKWKKNWALYQAVAFSASTHAFANSQYYSQPFSTKIKKFDYTLGAEITAISRDLNADAILFVYGFDHEATLGRKASLWWNVFMGAFTGITMIPLNPSFMSLGLVNASNGNLDWYKTTPPDNEYSFRNPHHIEDIIKWLTRDFLTQK